jgi:hypothetical protein
MKILVACEFSGIVSEEFVQRGHDVTSCDLLPTERRSGRHFVGDVREILYREKWDMLIAFPPCTFLSFAGNKYLMPEKYGAKAVLRKFLRTDAMEFFWELYYAPVEKICIENPWGEPMKYIDPTQTIYPYYFGDAEVKRTALWLKNLPPLFHSKVDTLFEQRSHIPMPEPTYKYRNGKNMYRTQAIGGKTKEGQKERSRFFPSVARAMGEQWG